MTGIRVLLVDDEELVRFGLRTVLESVGGFTVVGEAGDGAAGVRAARELRPDVVLIDIRMPVMDGLAATRNILALPRPPQVAVLTTFHVDEYVYAPAAAAAAVPRPAAVPGGGVRLRRAGRGGGRLPAQGHPAAGDRRGGTGRGRRD